MKKNKYSIGFWVVKVIKSCKTKKQLEGAMKLLNLFQNNLKYNPPHQLMNEIYKVYDEQNKHLNQMVFDPDIHL